MRHCDWCDSFYLISRAFDVIVLGLGKRLYETDCFRKHRWPKDHFVSFPVTSLTILCVLIYSILFVIDCLNGRSTNKKKD